MRGINVMLTSLAVGVLTSATLLPQGPGDPHLPVPRGFDFPADATELLAFRDTGNVEKMRRHSWMVFAGITQPAPGGEAIWETWWPSDQTFSTAAPLAAPGRRPGFRELRQTLSPQRGTAAAQAIGASQLSFVMFNSVAHDFIRRKKLHLSSTLDDFRAAGSADIEDFPKEAMSLKTTWWPVAQSGLTPLPVWDNEPTRPITEGAPNQGSPPARIGNIPFTWKRVVAVDPSRDTIPPGETATVKFFNPTAANPLSAPKIDRRGSKVVALRQFYSFKLTAEDISRSSAVLDDVFRPVLGRGPNPGDAVALVALHYTTKEIDDWVWSTFWWHDVPDAGPYGTNRPSQVQGVWRNYVMDTTFSMDTPREGDGKPNAAFNPWLEARFSNGVLSNCMTCHQRAVWPPVAFLPVTRGALPAGDPFFANRTRADFLWSVVLESQ
jgi:hypothetical protein